jgi:hypothetical protein
MTEYEQRHVDNFMRDFEDLLRRYNAVYKSTGFKDYTFPQIMFRGVPDDKGGTFLNALIVDLLTDINPK